LTIFEYIGSSSTTNILARPIFENLSQFRILFSN